MAQQAEIGSEKGQSVADKIREALSATDWDALVVLGGENVQYCSGAWIPYARAYLDRPNIVVWPTRGEPTFISGAELASGIKPNSFIERFVGYEEKGALPPAVIVDTVGEVLRELGLADGRIGLEMLRTSVLFYNRLRELLPDAQFESADALLRGLRLVKASGEIATMSEGARLTDDGVWKAFQASQAGQTERDVGLNIQLNVLGNGCSSITTLLVGTGEGARVLGPPTQRELKSGDIVRVDLNSVFGGYFCDMGRMAVVGEPTAEQQKAYRQQVELGERIYGFIRPGRKASEIHKYYLDQANEMGVKLFIYPYIGLGHGIGVNGDEYPKLNMGDETIVESGMILNVEPDTIGPSGEIFHVENMVLVQDDGVEVLTRSRDWAELPVIEAG